MSNSDDEVEVVSMRGNVAMRDFPHARHDCITQPFSADGSDNMPACSQCYCWLCDEKWDKCASWAMHCNAHDGCPIWIAKRNEALRARERARRRTEDSRPEVQQQRAAAAAQSRQAEEDRWLNNENNTEAAAANMATDVDEEVEELFQEYEPQLRIPGIDKHPTPAYETTSLSFVRTPTVDPASIKLAARVAAGSGMEFEGALSSLQMETVALAVHRHEQTLPGPGGAAAGFFLGDGPGVGKGRQVAGIIYEHYLRGRTNHVWISVSNDLLDDARRDVREIGCPLKVYHLNALTARQLREPPEGILFCTYATLIAREAGEAGKKAAAKRAAAPRTAEVEIEEEEEEAGGYDDDDEDGEPKRARKGRGVRMSVDSIVVDLDPTRRLTQIVHWMKKGGNGGRNGSCEGDGAIVFDESHRAKNLCPDGGVQTATGLAVLELQAALPRGKVVYCSATGCSSVKGMAYMTRLGLWGQGSPFPAFHVFEHAISKGGPGAMELVALDMKQRGMYLSRMLSYADCEFETVEVEPTPQQQQQYDDAVGFWRVAFVCCQHAAAELAQIGMKPKRGLMSLFWGTHQRFFKQLCMSIKVPELVRRAKAALKEGHAVVIGLQSTGEARLADAVKAAEAEEDLEDFRGLRALLEHLIDRFPCKESLAVRADDDANDGGTEKKSGGVRPKKAGAASADSTLLGRARVPAYVQAQNAARATAGGGAGPSATGAISLDSSDDDEYVDELADMLGIKNAKDTFRRMCEMELPLDDLKKLWSTMVGGAAGVARVPPSKKETVIAGLVTAFGAICAMDRAELRERLIQSGMPRARVPKARRDRIEALWRARAGDRLGGIGGSAAGSGAGSSAGAGGQRKMKGGDDGGGDDDEGASACERTLWRRLQELKTSMCDALVRLDLPENPLDQLIADLGGVHRVAELTGRKMRRVWEGGKMEVRARNCDLKNGGRTVPMLQVNNREKEEFLSDTKRVAIISEAASSGISLHADARFENRRRRVHMTIELAWSADEAIQQFGRTHRSNQISAPSYLLLMSTIGGERRFASSVAKRLQALGALTKGDRRASDAVNLDVFNFEHKYGTQAVNEILDMLRHPFHAVPEREVMDAVLEPKAHLKARRETAPGPALRSPGRPSPRGAAASGGGGGKEEPVGKSARAAGAGSGNGGGGSGGRDDDDARRRDAFEAYLADLEDGLAAAGIDASDDKWEEKTLQVQTFMNRMLGLTVELQARAFSHFSARVDALIKSAKQLGSFDAGIVDLNARYIRVRGEGQTLRQEALSGAAAKYYELEVDNGMSWTAREAELRHRLSLLQGDAGRSGSYEIKKAPLFANGRHLQHMLVRMPKPPFALSTYVDIYRDYTPHRGFTKLIAEDFIDQNYKKVEDPAVAKMHWEQAFEHSLKACMHGPLCSFVRPNGGHCLVGNRLRLVPFLSGSILPLWHEIASILGLVSTSADKVRPLKICRVRINAGDLKGSRLVGVRLEGDVWEKRLLDSGFNIRITKTDRNGQPMDGEPPLTREAGMGSPQARRRESRGMRAHRRSIAAFNADADSSDPIVVDEEPSAGTFAEQRVRNLRLVSGLVANGRKRPLEGAAGSSGGASGSILPHLQHRRTRTIADDDDVEDVLDVVTAPTPSLTAVPDFDAEPEVII